MKGSHRNLPGGSTVSTNKPENAVPAAILNVLKSPWGVAAILFLLVTAVFHSFIFSGDMLVSSDQMNGLDTKVFLKSALDTFHQFPLWFSSRLSGMPTIDALFGDIFYPPSILITLLAPIPKAIGYKMILHIFMAGIFFFLMLRKGFGMNTFVSLTGAVLYMFNPQFVSHIYPGHDGKMYVICWLPFIVWQLKVLCESPGILTATLLGAGIGMCILTSHIQLTYFVLWGAGFYWLTAAALLLFKNKDRKKALIVSGCFWGAVLIGLGIGSIQIFPSFLFIRDAMSVRGVDRGFEFASSWSLHWPELFSLWVPEFVNTLDYYWGQNPFKLNSEYAGMMPVLCSVGALLLKPRNPWRIFWACVAAAAALFALGANTPFFRIAYAIVPYVSKFRAASMIMFWFSFATILLSVLFLKDVACNAFGELSEEKLAKWRKGLFIACGVCLGITILFSMEGFVKWLFSSAIAMGGKERVFGINFTGKFLPWLWVWCIFTMSFLGMMIGLVGKKIPANVLIGAVLLIGAVDAIRVDSLFIKLINPNPYFYREEAISKLASEMKEAPFRCLSLPGALPQNGEGIHGLEGAGGFNDNELSWYREFRGDQQNRNFISTLIGSDNSGRQFLRADRLGGGNPFLDLANVKYLLVRSGNALMPIENKNALGRLSFVPEYIVASDSTKMADEIANGRYDYRRCVALTSRPALPSGFVLPKNSSFANVSGDLRTKWESYSPNYRKASITAPADGFVRISEVYYPGWEIKIDSKTVPHLRADCAWMAVPVREGAHVIEMIPHSRYLGRFIPVFIVSILLVSAVWCFCAFTALRNRKKAAS